MTYRSKPVGLAALSALLVSMALMGLAGRAAAQSPPPPPDGSDPGAAQPDPVPPPPAGQPTTAPPPATAQPTAPPPPAQGLHRARELQLQVGVGGEFFVFASQAIGNGPALKLSAHWLRWWGPFMLGGGPSIYYSYMFENREPADEIHQLTLNADLLVGGGIFQRFAVYGHVLLGFGFASAYDGGTRTKITTFWARAVAGVGGWAHITRVISLGVSVDVGWPGTVEVLASAAFHFGRAL